MTQEHPITPPPELTQEWSCDCPLTDPFSREFYVATKAARWGADQELEACRLWVSEESIYAARELVEARRPKPPSLKEQSLALIDKIQGSKKAWDISELNVIRRALEQLDDH